MITFYLSCVTFAMFVIMNTDHQYNVMFMIVTILSFVLFTKIGKEIYKNCLVVIREYKADYSINIKNNKLIIKDYFKENVFTKQDIESITIRSQLFNCSCLIISNYSFGIMANDKEKNEILNEINKL